MIAQSSTVPGFAGRTGGTDMGNKLIPEPKGDTGIPREES